MYQGNDAFRKGIPSVKAFFSFHIPNAHSAED